MLILPTLAACFDIHKVVDNLVTIGNKEISSSASLAAAWIVCNVIEFVVFILLPLSNMSATAKLQHPLKLDQTC